MDTFVHSRSAHPQIRGCGFRVASTGPDRSQTRRHGRSDPPLRRPRLRDHGGRTSPGAAHGRTPAHRSRCLPFPHRP
ncbi:hypothetical protein RAJCM14343_2664 [Rhodococcus aetherivorans]|uniref:Uncharacterized protein n=1 Tax=Rhodococcus aetherivorans TaxID=191292 RepID=A0ABQ0YLM6_9NOCA|nr:hypothetical protein RAJCM14343_2664 [Rhodococcus aetherivorans]